MNIHDGVAALEAEFDKMYHGPQFPRCDFDNGVARGIGLALAVVRGTSLDDEMIRSLNRLAELEKTGCAPWQSKGNQT